MRISLSSVIITACLLAKSVSSSSLLAAPTSIVQSRSSSKNSGSKNKPLIMSAATTTSTPVVSKGIVLPDAAKLIIGAGGIYGAFLYYGTLQEDVFHYKAANGDMFKYAWFLQAIGNKRKIRQFTDFFIC